MLVFSIKIRFVQEFFGGSTKTNDDGLIVERVFQLTVCSKTFQTFCSCSAGAEYRNENTGEGDEIGEKRTVV